MPTKKVVRVSWTWVALAVRSEPTCGKAGTYISVASGAIAVTRTTVPSTALVNRTGVCTDVTAHLHPMRSRVKAAGRVCRRFPSHPAGRGGGRLCRDVYQQGIP